MKSTFLFKMRKLTPPPHDDLMTPCHPDASRKLHFYMDVVGAVRALQGLNETSLTSGKLSLTPHLYLGSCL